MKYYLALFTGLLLFGNAFSQKSPGDSRLIAHWKMNETEGIPYDEMSFTFNTTNGLTHTETVTGLSNLTKYHYFCKCKDDEGTSNMMDYTLSFRIEDVLPQNSSYIPLVVIDTDGGLSIVDEPKRDATMKIIYNGTGEINSITDPGNIYDGKIGIEIRGAYSASLPQKPFLLETRTDSGTNNNVPLLGMPKENDWILNANYNDKSFVRNALPFELFRKMGHYAPRTKYCEVYINDDYRGIYLLCEKIKQDKNRVSISKLRETDNEGDQLTGGYIIKTDYYNSGDSWLSNYPPFDRPYDKVHFVYHYPAANKITVQQKEYIRDFIDTFEDVMHSPEFNDPQTGYTAYMDRLSFIDYFLISELSRNVDGYKKSRYFYKDRDSKGGKLFSGPVWDFDWAWKNIYDCPVFSRTDGSGWSYEAGKTCNQDVKPPMYMARLLEDETFVYALKNRYTSLRKSVLSEDYIFQYIDSSANYLNNAQQRHYEKWGTLGKKVGAPEVEPAANTYDEEIERLKDWISLRLTWLDENIPETVNISNEEISTAVYRVFPNPASDILFVESDRPMHNITLFNLSGKTEILNNSLHTWSADLNISHLPGGLYILKIDLETGDSKTVKVVIR